VNNQRKRPIGITLLALMFLWIGGWGTLMLPLTVVTGGVTPFRDLVVKWMEQSHPSLVPLAGVVVYLLFAIVYAFYVAYAFIGFGLWKLKDWARRGFMAVGLLMIAMGVVAAIAMPKELGADASKTILSIAALLWCAAPGAWVIWYTRRPLVLAAFGRYVPPPEQPDALPQKASRKTIVMMVVSGVMVMCVFGYAVFAVVQEMFQRSEPYKMALRQADGASCVATRVGIPFTTKRTTSGSLEESGSKGSADFSIPIRGEKGRGDLVLSAKEQDGRWTIQRLALTQNGQETEMVSEGVVVACQ